MGADELNFALITTEISLSERFDAQRLVDDIRFSGLDQSLQHIISYLARSQTSLAILVDQQSEQTRQHITAEVTRLEKFHLTERWFEGFTRSLFYPEISSREEQISHEFDGIENSYEWIFDKPSFSKEHTDNSPRWDDFPEWLQSNDSIYWINGKAGSGKSTLMSYVCNNEQTCDHLQKWSANRILLTPKCFFWNAGLRLEKAVEGLLRSIIYQLLHGCHDLITCFQASITDYRLRPPLIVVDRICRRDRCTLGMKSASCLPLIPCCHNLKFHLLYVGSLTVSTSSMAGTVNSSKWSIVFRSIPVRKSAFLADLCGNLRMRSLRSQVYGYRI